MSIIEAQRLSKTKRIKWPAQVLAACIICLMLLTLVQPALVNAAAQTIGGVEVEGNLRIQVADTGMMGVERYVAGTGWETQIYGGSPGSKGSKLYVNGTEIMLGYFDGTQANNTGNSVNGNTITTSWASGSIGITQKTTYTNGNAYYRLEWTITNNGGSVLNDLRFFHGEDTYLLGGDNGAGFWDAANHSIGVKKPDMSGVEQRMTLQGVTIPYAYESLSYWTSYDNASKNALSSTLDTNVSTDNGYALEWRTASLSPGASWTIIAFEKFNNAEAAGLSVTAPVSIDCEAGTTCSMNFNVQNVGSSSASVNLWLSGGPSWGETIISPGVPVTIAAGANQPVVVQVSVPSETTGGSTANITLNASDGTNTSSDTGGVYVPIPPAVAPTEFTSDAPASAIFGTDFSHTFVADGAPAPSYSITAGSLPPGLVFNSVSGLLSGTPSAAGQYNFTITAENPGGSFSLPYSIDVAKADTTTTVTADSPDPSSYGQDYTVSVTVSSATSGTPAGQVSVSDGTDNCSITLSGGSGSCTMPSNSIGAKTLTAVYAGNPNFNGSSDTELHSIEKADTTTLVTRSVASPVYGQPVYFTAEVNVVNPGAIAPEGQVQFYVDGEPFGELVDLNGGTADSPTTNSLSAGDHTYAAVYLDNANYNGSDTLPAAGFHVGKNSTAIAVISSAPTSVYGQPFHLTATVDEIGPSEITPTGQVQFLMDGAPLGQPVELNESGQVTTADLHTLLPAGHPLVGSHIFSASYLENANSLSSTSSASTQTITPAPTTVVVSSSEEQLGYGSSLDVTISVSADAPSLAIPAGMVQLSIDGVSVGTPLTLDDNGQAVQTVTHLNLPPGSHEIAAGYTPESPAQFAGSSNDSLPLVQQVNKASPVFTLTSTADSPVASQPVSYRVVVGPSLAAQGIPSGSVQFLVDGVPLGEPVILDAEGKADSPLSTGLAAGQHTITVGYSGDDYFHNVLASPALNQTVTKAGVVTRIISIDPAESVVGQPVTVTVQVSPVAPAAGTPDGTVIVSNGIDSCEATLDKAGTGSCELKATAPGSPELAAAYSGSANFTGASSDSFAGPQVSKANSSVGITGFDPEVPVTGQPVTIEFAAAPVAPGWGTLTGSVTITDRQGRTCTALISVGNCQITFDQAGPTGLSAVYEGDGNFNSSGLAEVAGPVIAKASTHVDLVSSTATSVYGQPVHFTAAVSVTDPGKGDPTGQVQFTIDGENFGEPVDLSSGSAVSPDVSGLAVATHTIGAEYLGDANFSASSASAVNQVVEKASTTLNLESIVNPSPYGMPALITATLTANNPSTVTPKGGTVQFFVDGVAYGEPVALNPNGQASQLLPYSIIWVGENEVTAVYSGDESFNGSDNLADSLLQVVEKGSLVIFLEPTILNPVFGQPVSFSVRVGEDSNNPVPTGTVQFSVDGVNLGDPVTLDKAGTALSQSIDTLTVGAHRLSVSYSGDASYLPVTASTPSGVVVKKAQPALAYNLYTPSEAVVGQQVTFYFDVQTAGPGFSGQPTGTVTVNYAGGSCTGDVSNGSCELIPTDVTPADAALSITYSGDESFLSQELSLQDGPAVGPAEVLMTITGTSTGPVVVGQPYTVTVQVAPVAPGTLIPVGRTITISNGTDSCTATIQADGSAACAITPTSSGEQNFSAVLDGGVNFTDETSTAAGGITVNAADTAVTLMSSTNPVLEGEPVGFTAYVQSVFPGGGVPSGQVQFLIDGQEFGDPVDLVNGTAASLETADLAVGSHAVTAVYLGNKDYNTSTSAALSQSTAAGDLGSEITPGEGGELVFDGEQNGLPVRTIIQIPPGAVTENVTLVFHQLEDSLLAPPAGQYFLANFTLEAYINGVLQPNLAFLQPVTITMSYDSANLEQNSLAVLGWDGSQWRDGGITVIENDPDAGTITFTLAGTGLTEFSLSGTHQYLHWMPVIGIDRK